MNSPLLLYKMFALFLIIAVLFVVSVNSNPCSGDESLNITNGVVFENGSVIHDGLEYPDGTWYVSSVNGSDVRFGCPCIGRLCLWKCCGIGQMFLNRTCEDVDLSEAHPFNPPVFKGRELTEVVAYKHFFYMPRQSCDMYALDSNEPNEEIYLQENGTLLEIAANLPQWHRPILFCLDMKLDPSSPRPRLAGGVCYPDSDSNADSPGLFIAYGIGLMLSVPFLLATFLVYAFIAELRNLHGLCLMAYCGGLIVAYPFLAYLKLHTGKVGVAMTGCFVIAFIIYYAFQSSFFWLNVMCFDIWRTFSGYRGGSTSKRRERKRFLMYGAYAWGVPAVLTAVTIGMQFGDNLPDDVITPGFGNRRCWFDNWMSELVYFFTPVFVLVVCNVVLFSVTANRIRSIRQETAILKGAESSRSDKLKKDKQRYGLYLKLFVIMGVNWSVEVISFAVGGSNWYWIVVDLSNIALGIYIFFIFVWKNKVRTLVVKKWRSVRGLPPDSSLGTWGTRSSSAPTEDTRVSADETGVRLREMR